MTETTKTFTLPSYPMIASLEFQVRVAKSSISELESIFAGCGEQPSPAIDAQISFLKSLVAEAISYMKILEGQQSNEAQQLAMQLALSEGADGEIAFVKISDGVYSVTWTRSFKTQPSIPHNADPGDHNGIPTGNSSTLDVELLNISCNPESAFVFTNQVESVGLVILQPASEVSNSDTPKKKFKR